VPILRPKILFRILGLAVVTGAAVFVLRPGSVPLIPAAGQAGSVGGTVRHVADGDTFFIRGVGPPIRIWGLDAPEWDRRGGEAATAALRRLIDGQNLTCRVRAIDKYERIVGQCFLPDGGDVTARMIAAGVAREYCYFSHNFYGTCGGN